jgi:hypothetical protein
VVIHPEHAQTIPSGCCLIKCAKVLSMTLLEPNPFSEQIAQLINFLSEQFEKDKALLQKSMDGISEILCIFMATFDGHLY